MDSNLVNNNFSVNLETLRNCFQLVGRKDQQNQQMIMEAQKYIEECKKDRQFPAILLMTFDNQEEDAQIRLLSIIEFKNMVKDNWVIRKTSKSTSVYPDQDKKEIRTTLLNFLDKYQDKTSRSQINDILKIISFTDFPTQFGELVQYFLDNMQGLRQTLTDHSMLLSDVTLNFVKTLKIIMTERSRKRIGDHRNLFFNVYLKLMEAFHEFWDYFHVNMGSLVGAANSQNFNQIQRFISLARKSDNIYISFLCNGCEEMVESENIVKIASLIVQRAAELTEMVKSLKGNKDLVDVYQELNKNLYKYLYSLSQLQAIFPLVFKDVITNYIKLIEFIIDNPESFDNEYVLRAAIICLNSALRRYSYHGDDISVSKRQSQIGNYEEIKKQCIIEFYNYFSLEKIENFFNIFLLKLLPRRPVLTGEQDSNSLDEFVEIENDNFTSDFEKLETPIYNLTLKCTSELLIRFSEQAIPLIHGLANKVVNNELSSLPPIIQDGIFAMIGQLPDVYQQKKINADNYLDLGSVLKYLEERAGSDLNLSKRIPVLIHKWMSLFNAGVKAQIVQNVVQITQSLQNYVVRYECCMCLKVILKSPEVLEIDYAAISEHLVPIIIDLLGRFRNPQATWGLIEVLKLLFTKAQYSAQNDNIIAQLQSQNIQVLTKIDDPLLLPALVDMFKIVIASFPFGTCLSSIFKICIDYVDFHFKENRFRPALLSLWLFLAREYHEIQDVGEAMKTMFGRYSGSLLGMNNPDELSKFINIIEEYILAELISPDDYLSIIKIMEDKTEITFKVSVTTENIYNLKSALLSLMSTLVLIVLRQNNMENLKIFNKLLAFLLRDLLNNFFDPAFRSLKAFKMSMLTLINRFIILNTQGVLEMLEKFQVGFNNFLGEWINNMNFLLSNQTRRINAVAVMTLLPYINDKELLGECLDDLLKHTIPELRRILDGDDKPPVLHDQKPLGTRERCEDIRDSERKKVIRQDALYYDVDLRELFVKTFRDAIARNNFSLDDLRACVKDATVLEEFLSLIN